MIAIDNVEIVGWEHAIRGMRNPLNSWDKSDSEYLGDLIEVNASGNALANFMVGDNDLDLMKRLNSAGQPSHSKYKRMIVVYMDINAPLYWWKEFDTYKVGTVANSCSTMHKIQAKEFEPIDFSHEHLNDGSYAVLDMTISALNVAREDFLKSKDKTDWWQMIQLLPSSYNQRRTVMLNYEVLTNIYHDRKNHKLDEWKTFCSVIETLPYKELITGGKTNE